MSGSTTCTSIPPPCVGSLGLLPSASLGDGPGLFEPIHGSAPDIAGRDLANPIGAIATVAMLLRNGLRLAEPAAAVDRAIELALEQGARTRDIAAPGGGARTRHAGNGIAHRGADRRGTAVAGVGGELD